MASNMSHRLDHTTSETPEDGDATMAEDSPTLPISESRPSVSTTQAEPNPKFDLRHSLSTSQSASRQTTELRPSRSTGQVQSVQSKSMANHELRPPRSTTQSRATLRHSTEIPILGPSQPTPSTSVTAFEISERFLGPSILNTARESTSYPPGEEQDDSQQFTFKSAYTLEYTPGRGPDLCDLLKQHQEKKAEFHNAGSPRNPAHEPASTDNGDRATSTGLSEVMKAATSEPSSLPSNNDVFGEDFEQIIEESPEPDLFADLDPTPISTSDNTKKLDWNDAVVEEQGSVQNTNPSKECHSRQVSEEEDVSEQHEQDSNVSIVHERQAKEEPTADHVRTAKQVPIEPIGKDWRKFEIYRPQWYTEGEKGKQYRKTLAPVRIQRIKELATSLGHTNGRSQLLRHDDVNPANEPEHMIAPDQPWVYTMAEDSLNVADAIRRDVVRRGESPSRVLVVVACDWWQPSGWLFKGSPAQEESISARTTNHDSQDSAFYNYRSFMGKPALGEDQFIYSPNILVTHLDMDVEMATDRMFTIDIVSIPAVFKPLKLEQPHPFDKNSTVEMYANPMDRADMRQKFLTIMRLAVQTGHEYVVLPCLGCGVWKNPPREVAAIAHEVLLEQTKEHWPSLGIKRVVIAAFDKSEDLVTLDAFQQAFADDIEAHVDARLETYLRWKFGDLL